MQKYKQVNVVHPEDVGVPKGIMSDSPQESAPSPAFRGSIWPLVIIALIILALALYFVPWPERMELSMDGAKVDKQGNVITEGEIVVEGWQYHYLFQSDKFRLTKIELPGVEVKSIIEVQGDSGFYPWFRDLISAGVCFGVQGDDYWTSNIITTESYDFLAIYKIGSSYVFIGAAEGTPNYAEILDRCGLLEK